MSITFKINKTLTDANEGYFDTFGADNTRIIALGGADTVITGAGHDSVDGGAGDDVLRGAAGNDTLVAGSGWDQLFGGSGDDVLRATVSGSSARLIGGGGSDTYFVRSDVLHEIWDHGVAWQAASDEQGEGGIDTVYLTMVPGTEWSANASSFEYIRITSPEPMGLHDRGHVYAGFCANDVSIVSSGGYTPLIHGQSGNDTLRGHTGRELLWGEADDDLLIGAHGDDSLHGGTGADTLDGGNDNDVLVGGEGRDTLDGGAGNDTMLGGADDDTYRVEDLEDVVTEYANEGFDLVETSLASMTLGGNVEAMRFIGLGNFFGLGNLLDNVITGGMGHDVVLGGAGRDSLSGGTLGNDSLSGGAGADTLDGGLGDDTLNGGVDADLLRGGSGNDRLVAGDGNDTVVGGAGLDVLFGGLGADRFCFGSASESGLGAGDRVGDFVAGLDILDLAGVDANAAVAGNQAFVFRGATMAEQRFYNAGDLWAKTTAGGVELKADVTGDGVADFQIVLSGIAAIGAADIVL